MVTPVGWLVGKSRLDSRKYTHSLINASPSGIGSAKISSSSALSLASIAALTKAQCSLTSRRVAFCVTESCPSRHVLCDFRNDEAVYMVSMDRGSASSSGQWRQRKQRKFSTAD